MKLDKAILTLNDYSRRGRSSVSAWSYLAVTVCYLAAVLSVLVSEPQTLVWLAICPVVASEACGIGFWKIFRGSLYVLPLILLVGIFNPVYDRAAAFMIGSVEISRGWVSFASVLLRGLLSMQALLLLVSQSGFYDLCAVLRRCGMPRVLVTQLLFTYRYMGVLMEEAQTMHRARVARGFGRGSYPLREWGSFVGQLLLRSVARAGRIHDAMLARGFDGILPLGKERTSGRNSWLFLIGGIVLTGVLRFVDFSALIAGAV